MVVRQIDRILSFNTRFSKWQCLTKIRHCLTCISDTMASLDIASICEKWISPAYRVGQALGLRLGQVHQAVFPGFKLASQGEDKGKAQFTQKQSGIYSCSCRSSNEGLHIQGILLTKVRYAHFRSLYSKTLDTSIPCPSAKSE